MDVRYATFSIVARDPANGQLGVAIASKPPCVGSFCPLIRPGLGAAVTQAWTNPHLTHRVLERLAAGVDAKAALADVMSGEVDAALRQVAVVDHRGRASAFTGDKVDPASGHRITEQCTIQGNMLASGAVLDAMAVAFASHPEQPLASRLLAALAAGARVGGDARGARSAAVQVFGAEIYPLVDLRVDWHEQPVLELGRLFRIAERELFPFVAALPTRDNPRGRFETVRAALRPPRVR